MHLLRSFIALTSVLAVLSSPVALQEGKSSPTFGDPWEEKDLSISSLDKVLQASQEALKAIPESEKEDSPQGKRRLYLKRRIALLEELVQILKRREAVQEEMRALPVEEALKRDIQALKDRPAPSPPPRPTSKGLEEVQARISLAQRQVEDRDKEEKGLQKRIEETPARILAARNRGTEAEARIGNFTRELPGVKEEADRTIIQERMRNARLEVRLVSEAVRLHEEEQAAAKKAAPLLILHLDLDRRRLKGIEEEYGLYQTALKENLEAEKTAREKDLAEKKQAEAEAETPWERFLAGIEKDIAQLKAEVTVLEKRKQTLQESIQRQENLLKAERNDLVSLKELLDKAGDSTLAVNRLKETFMRVRHRERALGNSLQTGLSKEIEGYYDRQFYINEDLATLEKRWTERVDAFRREIPNYPRERFDQRIEKLRDRYIEVLDRKVKPLLGELIAAAVDLDAKQLERRKILEETEAFVRARALWVRDARTLDLEVLDQAAGELGHLARWSRSAFTGDILVRVRKNRTYLQLILYGFALLVLLPITLIWVRHRIRRFQGRYLESTNLRRHKLLITLLSVLGTFLVPAYLYAAALLVRTLDLPASLHHVLGTVLSSLSVLLLLLALTRLFFGGNGLAPMLYGMKEDTARSLNRALHLLLLAGILFLMPWALLQQAPPFGFIGLPRILYTLFEASALVGLFLLMRRGSPLIRDTVGNDVKLNPLARFWGLLSVLAFLLFLVILAMDVLGYRFGAARLAWSVLLTLGTLILLMAFYRILTSLVEDILRKRRRDITTAPGESPKASALVMGQQTRRFIRAAFIIAGLVLLATYWGFDERALQVLDNVSLYTLSSTGDRPPEIVSLADVVKSLLILVITFWLLNYLPGIYEVALFPRFKWDSGLRYAILTISRYGIVFLGVIIALTAIHLDLGRLGWLMAAVGFGLGFGLQEIFSNFIAGIILLVERPIRVGDTITVGAISGEVKRINIRATTVLNWDRMEVVIPNKDLITKEATNWTLSDKVTRITVPVGVAYGSDIDRVHATLLEIAEAEDEVLKDPEPKALFLLHGDSTLNFELRVFVPKLNKRLEMIDRLNTIINKEFKARGIEIAFPQRDLHIRSDSTRAPEKGAEGKAITCERP